MILFVVHELPKILAQYITSSVITTLHLVTSYLYLAKLKVLVLVFMYTVHVLGPSMLCVTVTVTVQVYK